MISSLFTFGDYTVSWDNDEQTGKPTNIRSSGFNCNIEVDQDIFEVDGVDPVALPIIWRINLTTQNNNASIRFLFNYTIEENSSAAIYLNQHCDDEWDTCEEEMDEDDRATVAAFIAAHF